MPALCNILCVLGETLEHTWTVRVGRTTLKVFGNKCWATWQKQLNSDPEMHLQKHCIVSRKYPKKIAEKVFGNTNARIHFAGGRILYWNTISKNIRDIFISRSTNYVCPVTKTRKKHGVHYSKHVWYNYKQTNEHSPYGATWISAFMLTINFSQGYLFAFSILSIHNKTFYF